MAAAVSIAQTFEPLASAVRLPANETWIAAAALDRARAEHQMRETVLPHLVHRDDRDALHLAPRLVYAPFWRVKLTVSVGHLRVPPNVVSISNIAFPMPAPLFGGRAGVMMISARTVVPYTPRLPSFFGGTDALEVQRSALVPMTNENVVSILSGGEIVDADVDRERGETMAASVLMTLLGEPEPEPEISVDRPRIESTTFVLYPLWYARFGDDGHHVLLSARDGKVVSARYPRPPTISERVKRFFTA